jgi:hypothetical protein
MARTGVRQERIDSMIKSPTAACGPAAKRGPDATACTMQSVAERTSGSVPAVHGENDFVSASGVIR